eukprot:m.410617 g.410617  ORF g.410617 m.410617 type:complete len:339 (+) comp20159_c0_seq10:2326-3342(+)
MAFSTEPSQLPIGTTKVVASAVDANDNMGSCTFHVTVEVLELCHDCDSGETYENVPCGSTEARQCLPCSTCTDAATAPCTPTDNRQCTSLPTDLRLAASAALPEQPGVQLIQASDDVFLGTGISQGDVAVIEYATGIDVAGVSLTNSLASVHGHMHDAIGLLRRSQPDLSPLVDVAVSELLSAHRTLLLEETTLVKQDSSVLCSTSAGDPQWASRAQSLLSIVSTLAKDLRHAVPLPVEGEPSIGTSGEKLVIGADSVVFAASDLLLRHTNDTALSSVAAAFLDADGRLTLRSPFVDIQAQLYVLMATGGLWSVMGEVLTVAVELQEFIARLIAVPCG